MTALTRDLVTIAMAILSVLAIIFAADHPKDVAYVMVLILGVLAALAWSSW